MAHTDGIFLKKKYGQHFLRDNSITDAMINEVNLTPNTNVLEIGCGDGFLTREILATDVERLWVFEIDPDWAEYVKTELPDPRLTIFLDDVIQADFEPLKAYASWVLLANLPYQVTFPILHKLQKHRTLFAEGVVMVQEEVAQKIVKRGGRGFGYQALFFQRYFEWKLLTKIPPTAFYPPPKVNSRLLYFKPHTDVKTIPDEQNFWKFIKFCFAKPRQMLKNNLQRTSFDIARVPEKFFKLRAQQMTMEDFLEIWNLIRNKNNLR